MKRRSYWTLVVDLIMQARDTEVPVVNLSRPQHPANLKSMVCPALCELRQTCLSPLDPGTPHGSHLQHPCYALRSKYHPLRALRQGLLSICHLSHHYEV